MRADPSLAEYASRYFTCGAVYLDADWSFYEALGSRKIGLEGLWQYAWNPLKAFDRIRGMREKHIDGNLNGEGLTLGGVLVLAPGNAGVVYTYLEKTGEALPISEIQQAVSQVVAMRKTADYPDEKCQES